MIPSDVNFPTLERTKNDVQAVLQCIGMSAGVIAPVSVTAERRLQRILGLTIEITNGKHSVTREVAGLGGASDDNLSVELEHPVKHSFSAGDAVIRYPADQMQETLRESQRDMEELGFEVNTLLAPYDDFDEWSMKFVPEYYDGVANARHGSRINDPEEFNPYATQRNYFIEFTSPEYVKQDLDEIADRGALGVLGAHAAKKEVTEERIRETLQWVNDRGIEVMTLRDAIERFAH